MWALILNKKVVDKQEKTFQVHSSMRWVECDNSIEVGYTYENNQFIKPEPPQIAYDLERRMNYPQLADFVDAYYWAQRGNNDKMNEYLAKCDDVKAKYPKPESN